MCDSVSLASNLLSSVACLYFQVRPESVLACLGLSPQTTVHWDHILDNAMLWWSSNETSDAKVSGSDAGETNVSPKQPATGGYGLPDDRALEPLHAPPQPSPAPASPLAPTSSRPPAPMPSRASPKVVAETGTFSTQAERLDKQWLLHILDEHMSKMQESFNELQRSVDERFEAVESDVAQARSTISANAGALKRLGLACTNLDAEIKQTKVHTTKSVARLSQAAPSQASSNWIKDIQEAVQFVQESTQQRVEDVARVQRKLTGFVRDSMRKAKHEVHTINQKLLNLSVSASLFSLKVGEMSDRQRQHSIAALQKKQAELQTHSGQASENGDTDDQTEKLEFEQWLTSGQEDSASSRAEEPSQEDLPSAELEIEKLVEETTPIVPLEKSTSIQANASETREPPAGHVQKHGGSHQDRPVVDTPQLQNLVQEFASSEMQGLDAKMTLLSLSSNLFCIKTIGLGKPVRERLVNLLECQLKAVKARTGHLSNLSYLKIASDAALEALDSETRLLESSHIASAAAAAEFASASNDAVPEDAARSTAIGEESVGPEKGSSSHVDCTVPSEIEEPVSMMYSRPTQSMKL